MSEWTEKREAEVRARLDTERKIGLDNFEVYALATSDLPDALDEIARLRAELEKALGRCSW